MYTLKLKPLNDTTKQLYNGHQNFHDGDAGLDVFFQENISFYSGTTKLVPLGFKSEMVDENGNNVTYLLKPRSSIYKTTLRQSNTEGVIDAGYRGELMVPIDCLITDANFIVSIDSGSSYKRTHTSVKKGERLFQICAPGMKPFKLEVLKDDEMLSDSSRGEGGFGSTGK